MRLSIFLLLFIACNTRNNIPSIEDQVLPPGDPPQWVFYPAKSEKKNKHIVLVSGDEEYRSEEALPQMGKILSEHHGFDCTVLFAQDPMKPGIVDPNYSFNIPGLEHLKMADMLILFTRFRSLPTGQMAHFENYLKAGKPIFAIRTATHAFNFKDQNHPYAHYGWRYNGDKSEWKLGFGKKILGETWYTHHGWHKHQSTRGTIATGAEDHPIVNGIPNGSMWGPTDVYGIREPIGGDAQSIFLGQSIDRVGEYDADDPFYGMKESDNIVSTKSHHGDSDKAYNPNERMPPIVWTKSYQIEGGQKGKSVTSTIGAAIDLLDEEVRRLFVNSCYYLLDLEVPEKADVSLVGNYNPSTFQFHTDEYWDSLNIQVPRMVHPAAPDPNGGPSAQ